MTELSRETTKAMNKIMQLFVNQQHNHGPTGQLRGFIRRVRDKISYVDKKTQQRVPLRDTEVNKALYDAYNEVLGATKLQLNGENILSPPICDYEDKEEKFYCMETVGYGYKYCLDHWIIIKEMKKNSGLEISD